MQYRTASRFRMIRHWLRNVLLSGVEVSALGHGSVLIVTVKDMYRGGSTAEKFRPYGDLEIWVAV